MPSLNINNVITVSVSTPPTGLADYQVNNLAIFTKETPVNEDITAANPGIYRSPTDVLADWGANSEVYDMAVAIFSQQPNILNGDGQLIISPMESDDTLDEVIPVLQPIVYFGGALYAGYAPTNEEIEDAADVCEPLRVKLFVSQHEDTAVAGIFTTLKNSSLPHTRMLLYLVGGSAITARLMAAAYAGRAMCVDFTGSNTTNTMHLKQLTGIEVDLDLTQTILAACLVAGVDTYPAIAGRPSVFCSGANDFWDNVYNLDWLVLALTVAGFNALATTGTKLPQTEPGIAVLKGAYISVLKFGVSNGFVAPGAWNSPELFGNPADLVRNILELGYYIYSQPVNQQSQSAREDREAPLIQIAVKYAGAVHSSSVVVFINR
jgi:hypothetical protein